MRLCVTTEQGNLFNLEVDPSMELENFKALVEAESGIPMQEQQLYFNGNALVDDKKSLESYGVKMDDILLVRSSSSFRPTAGSTGLNAAASSNAAMEREIEQIRQQILSNVALRAQVAATAPAAVNALNDPARFRQAFMESMISQRQTSLRQMQEMNSLEADPFDVESQKRIEELIRQKQIEENYQNAVEYNPESFGRVIMLYIPCAINNHSMAAFVDSGAQITIMSPSLAEKCGLTRLIDKRFAGTAVGVGTAKILGKVHAATMKLGNDTDNKKNVFLPCSFTIMEGKNVELLLGLDMLKRFQACIDLKKNVLRFEEAEIPFLGEADLPETAKQITLPSPTAETENKEESSASGNRKKETVSGPNTTAPSSYGSGGSEDQNSSSQKTFPEADIQQLMGLGVSRQQAITSLEATGGNMELAASLLFSM